MERNQLIAIVIAIALVAGGAYLLLSQNGVTGKYSGISIDAKPTGTSKLPSRNCYMGAEPIFGGGGSRITFACAFILTNYGMDLPAGGEFHLIFNNELSTKAKLDTRYANGSVVFGGKKDFAFTKEFLGGDYSPQSIYAGGKDFDYKLVYCIDCADPLKDGIAVYSNSTKFCCKLPSVSIGSPANPCD